MEGFLKLKGEEVRRKWVGQTLELTQDDLSGWSPKPQPDVDKDPDNK